MHNLCIDLCIHFYSFYWYRIYFTWKVVDCYLNQFPPSVTVVRMILPSLQIAKKIEKKNWAINELRNSKYHSPARIIYMEYILKKPTDFFPSSTEYCTDPLHKNMKIPHFLPRYQKTPLFMLTRGRTIHTWISWEYYIPPPVDRSIQQR